MVDTELAKVYLPNRQDAQQEFEAFWRDAHENGGKVDPEQAVNAVAAAVTNGVKKETIHKVLRWYEFTPIEIDQMLYLAGPAIRARSRLVGLFYLVSGIVFAGLAAGIVMLVEVYHENLPPELGMLVFSLIAMFSVPAFVGVVLGGIKLVTGWAGY